MFDSIRLYIRYVGFSLRSQMQYRASLLMYAGGNLLTTALEFFAIWALFERFGQIRGWTLAEIALLYGMANIAFAISEMAGRGFKDVHQLIKSGDFDRYLVRPRGTALQVGAQAVDVIRVGRLVQGSAILTYAVITLGAAAHLPLILAAIAGGACTFTGIFILQGTLTFWTVEGLEITATVTYGGVETTQYPLSIYTPNFRRFFTYVIPLAFLNYLPALEILDRDPQIPAWLSPLVGIVFLAASLRVWRLGVSHYRSTGS